MPTCRRHPGTKLICPRCHAAKLGSISTPKKAAAAKRNAQVRRNPEIPRIMAEHGCSRQMAYYFLAKQKKGERK